MRNLRHLRAAKTVLVERYGVSVIHQPRNVWQSDRHILSLLALHDAPFSTNRELADCIS